MTARRPRLDDASEAYLARLLAETPPLSEERKKRLARLLTPPRVVEPHRSAGPPTSPTSRTSWEVEDAAA